MSEAERNAETVRRGYAAFNAADMKALTEPFHESASRHTLGRDRFLLREHGAYDRVW